MRLYVPCLGERETEREREKKESESVFMKGGERKRDSRDVCLQDKSKLS